MNKAPPIPAPTPADLERLKRVRKDDTLKKPKAAPLRRRVPPPRSAPPRPCTKCGKDLRAGGGADGEAKPVTVTEDGSEFCSTCFACATCNCELKPDYYKHGAAVYCLMHYCDVMGYTCARCNTKITSGTVMRALDQVWHMETCFVCARKGCEKKFDASSAFYSPDDQFPYCRDHLPPRCDGCSSFFKPFETAHDAIGKLYHDRCCKCFGCGTNVTAGCYDVGGQPHCDACSRKGGGGGGKSAAAGGSACPACGTSIASDDSATLADGVKYHQRCFKCATCQQTLTSEFWPVGGKLFCAAHAAEAKGDTCHGCKTTITGGKVMVVCDKKWHVECVACAACKCKLGSGEIYAKGNEPHCKACATA